MIKTKEVIPTNPKSKVKPISSTDLDRIICSKMKIAPKIYFDSISEYGVKYAESKTHTKKASRQLLRTSNFWNWFRNRISSFNSLFLAHYFTQLESGRINKESPSDTYLKSLDRFFTNEILKFPRA